MTTTSPTRALAAFAAGLRAEAVPTEVMTKARDLLLDYLGGCAVAVGEDPAQRLAKFATAMGGPEVATIIGAGRKVAPPWAALVNGTLGHMAELDDTHRGTMSHPGDSMWASALATAETAGATGTELIVAAIAGYEVALRIGEAMMPDHYRRGWHTSGTIMAFGAAAVAARLLGLDARATAWALGTAGAQAAGNFAHLTERAMTKDFNCGHAAKSGVIAAMLAKEGFTGPTDMIENRRGFMTLYGGATFPEKLTAGLGSTWRILGVAHKPYSACRHIHASIDSLLAAQAALGFAPEAVESITARIFKTGADYVNDPVPWEGDKGLQGTRFSAQFNCAVVLLHGRAGLADLFEDDKVRAYLAAPEVRRAMRLVQVVADADLDKSFPDQWSSCVEVRLKDGRSHQQRVDYPLGEPEYPMSPAQLEEKFRRLTRLAGWQDDRASRVIALVARLASQDDVRRLVAAL